MWVNSVLVQSRYEKPVLSLMLVQEKVFDKWVIQSFKNKSFQFVWTPVEIINLRIAFTNLRFTCTVELKLSGLVGPTSDPDN